MLARKLSLLTALRCKDLEERLKARWRAFVERFKDNVDHYACVALLFGYIIFFGVIIWIAIIAIKWFLLAFCAWLMFLGLNHALRELGFFKGSRYD